MPDSRRRVRPPALRAQGRSRGSKDRSLIHTPEQLVRAQDLPATVAIPAFAESVEYHLRVDGTAGSKVRVTDKRAADGSSTLIVNARGALSEVAPQVASGEWVARGARAARTARVDAITSAFRPPWLRQVYVPKNLTLRTPTRRWIPDPPLRTMVQLLVETDYPWCAIGRVETTRTGQEPRYGSGVLVGPDLLLTASHVMPWDTDDSSIRFTPAYRAAIDPRFGYTYVGRYRGVPYAFDNDATGTDYVICKLNWRIGDRTGWLGAQWWSNEDRYHDGLWFSAGYPLSFAGGYLPASELWIEIEDIDNDADGLQIETDNFASEGWSGGPLWGWIDNDPRVIGILSGMDWDWPDPKRSLFAGGRHMLNLIHYAQDNWA